MHWPFLSKCIFVLLEIELSPIPLFCLYMFSVQICKVVLIESKQLEEKKKVIANCSWPKFIIAPIARGMLIMHQEFKGLKLEH